MSKWTERYGRIYFSIPIPSLSGPEWFFHLRNNNIKISETAHELLFDSNFNTTTSSIERIVLVRQSQFLGSGKQVNLEELLSSRKNDFIKPPRELGCAMLSFFSPEEIKSMVSVDDEGKRKAGDLDFNIFISHPFKDQEKDSMVFYISCESGIISLEAITIFSLRYLTKVVGFVFKVQ